MKIAVHFVLFYMIIAHSGISQSATTDYGNNSAAGNYVEVNGIKMYYEIYGEGPPLLLIHGNGGSIKGHTNRIEHFKKNYLVIAADARAHGKSQDIGDSLTYSNMTSDLNALLDHLDIDSCYIWGQSDGGIIGLKLAIDYPDKVKKVAVFGANLNPDTLAVFPSIANWVDETIAKTTDSHEKRLYELLKYQPQISLSDLNKIKAPVLIMSGDRDVIRLEHSLEIFYNIENSNLFIMPGATHFGAYEKPELFNMVVDDFFEKPFVKPATVDIFK